MPDPLTRLRLLQRSTVRLLRTQYPGFVFGMPGVAPSCPVFCYHEVERESFAADLRFLAENGYRTLGSAEFLETASRGDRRAVLLTFDDARRNFWDVAFPLLQQFTARVTLFVPTAWIEGGATDTEAEAEAPPGTFMSWDQLHRCVASGLVDVGAHGHRHALVYTSTRLVGFATPELVRHQPLYDWPMRYEDSRNWLGAAPLGTPIYEAEPLLSARCRVLENEAAARACQRLVQESGGEGFFQRSDASTQLRHAYRNALQHGGGVRRVEGPEFNALVRLEFERSYELLHSKLNRWPEFFAYPWMLGSDLSLRIAAEVGVTAVFGVGFDFRRARRLSGPVKAFGRLKGDWLRFLPGRGRRRLRDIVPEKLAQLRTSQHLAH